MKLSEQLESLAKGDALADPEWIAKLAQRAANMERRLEDWVKNASQLQQAQTWIPVETGLPETEATVEVWTATGGPFYGSCEQGADHRYWLLQGIGMAYEDGSFRVTHWKQLSAAPSPEVLNPT